MKIQEWQVKKIEEMRKEGKGYREIAFEVDISPEMVRYICNNIRRYKKRFDLEDKEDHNETKVEDSVARGFKVIRLELSYKDYMYFLKIKNEIEKKLGEVSEEYVFYRLLELYRNYTELEEENKKLKKILERYAHV